MKKFLLAMWIIVLTIVLGAIAISGYFYIKGNFSNSSGITAEEALQVIPVPRNIILSGQSQKEGVLLKWKSPEDISGDYYDVYRKISRLEAGWGENIGRIALEADSLSSYEFMDNNVEIGRGYIYQIILIRLANGYEVKEQASNSVEIIYK